MFTVIIPVHNKLPHIERSINSVLNQTFSDFELILVDDASTDGSSEKLQVFEDPRIRILKRSIPGPGGYAARNLGIKNAHHEWISFLDADDEWEENYLEKIYKTIGEFKDVDFITTGYDNIYEGGEKKKNPRLKFDSGYTFFSLSDYFTNNSIVWTGVVNVKRNLILKVGMFPEGRCKRGGDMDTWIRCIYASEKAVRINQILAHYYRDTVNRVTDSKINPSTTFCPDKTIELIKRENANNKKLIRSIDTYVAKYVYYKNVDLINSSRETNLHMISRISSSKLRLQVYFKLLIKKTLMKFRIF